MFDSSDELAGSIIDFKKIAFGAFGNGFFENFVTADVSENIDRSVVFSPDGAKNFKAGHSGKHEVKDDEVEIIFLDFFKSALAIFGFGNFITLFLESGFIKTTNIEVVFDEKKFFHG